MMLCCRVLHQHRYVFRMIFSYSFLLLLHLVSVHLQQEAVSPHVACYKRVLEMFAIDGCIFHFNNRCKIHQSICRAHNRKLLCVWKAWPQSDMFWLSSSVIRNCLCQHSDWSFLSGVNPTERERTQTWILLQLKSPHSQTPLLTSHTFTEGFACQDKWKR